ncbi:MAG TPA: IPTL-CTERM sorting domain-containing protein [Candidatus Polarisedimenticolia bacterium]|nr:IPTL-CTERM sorting domain-containing protein [Candidatus Polarisedimenticolia bacterium]
MTGRQAAARVALIVLSILVASAASMDSVFACKGTTTPGGGVGRVSLIQTAPTTVVVRITGGPTFPVPNPATSTCACGLAVKSGFAVTAARIVDANGNPVPGFTGFTADADSTAAFQAFSAAPGGYTWSGFSSPVTSAIPNGGTSFFEFDVTIPQGTNAEMLRSNIEGGKVGGAQGDLTGGNFDPDHRGASLVSVTPVDSIPTLSEWGIILLTALMVVGGTLVMLRRHRSAAA